MPYDDQRGRTGSFSTDLAIGNTGQGGGTVNYGPGGTATSATGTEFLGGSGGFLQGGGNGGGFTNFSAYLMANPNGGPGNDVAQGSGTPGGNALDLAMYNATNHAYGTTGTDTGGGTGATGTGATGTTGTTGTGVGIGSGAGSGGTTGFGGSGTGGSTGGPTGAQGGTGASGGGNNNPEGGGHVTNLAFGGSLPGTAPSATSGSSFTKKYLF